MFASPASNFVYFPNFSGSNIKGVTATRTPIEKVKVALSKDEFIYFQITEFINKAKLSQDCQGKLRNYFSGHVPGVQKDRACTADELFQTILSLTYLIHEKKIEAEKKGLPFLILLGENHLSREALILEFMILAIANDLNITTNLVELDKNTLLEELLNNELKDVESFDQIHFQNLPFAVHFAKKLRMKTVPVDPSHHVATMALDFKDKLKALGRLTPQAKFLCNFFVYGPLRILGIIHSTLRVNCDAVGILGSDHLEEIMQNPRAANYSILALQLGEYESSNPPAKNVTQISLQSSGTPYGFDFIKIQGDALKYQRAARLYLIALRSGIYPERKVITLN